MDYLAECHVEQYGGILGHRQNLVELCTVMSIAGAESLDYFPCEVRSSVLEKARELEILTTLDELIDGKATTSVLNLERH